MRFISSIGLIRGIPVVIVMAGILFSCVNDLDAIEKVTYDPNAPDEVTTDLEVFYNDSGAAQIRIYAKLAESYLKPHKVTKLKDGIQVDFFSNNGQIISTLTALYGEVNFETGRIFVQDSVQLKNHEKNQVLSTEQLFWNQKDSTVYTNNNVVIRTQDGVLYGKGIRTKHTMAEDKFKFFKPYGDLTEVTKE
jgi:LPS export ABC transporter protein LptC